MLGETSKPTRLFFIDNLGILLITLVVVFHLSVTYGASGFWPYRENPQPDDLTALLFTLFTALNGPYVVGFFFLIAGYFTPRSYDRKGFWLFLRDRLIRLGIPFVLYILVFDPLIYYAIKSTARGHWGSFLEYLSNHFRGYRALGVGPLWFVEGLLIFTILYALWRLTARTTPNPSQRDAPAPGNLAIALFALGLGVVTFILRLWMPVGSLIEVLSLPIPLFPQYSALFIVGIVAYRRNWFMGVPDATGKRWFGVALFFIVVLFPLVFLLGGALEGNTDPYMGGLYWQSFAYSVWEEFVCVGMILALLVFFRKRFNRQDALARALSASTYTVYFIHAPVLVFLALALRDFSVHPLLKFALVSPLVVVLCFTISYLLKKLPIIRSIL
jgi:surface polysaccharide O-acyltransferase-like enzyme